MILHTNPRQCLAKLSQQLTDGGRTEFLEQEWKSTGTLPEIPTGDCAVVALVYAAFDSPTGRSYGEAKYRLSVSIQPRMYNKRKMGEKLPDFLHRRVRQWVRAPKLNPIHGTPTHATSHVITTLFHYELIFPNEEKRWYCICDMESAYVLDVLIPGDHTMTVHEGVAYTTAPFDPGETIVGNVHWLSPEKTRRLKAMRQKEARRKEEERKWWRERWEESYGRFLPEDSELRRKMEDRP